MFVETSVFIAALKPDSFSRAALMRIAAIHKLITSDYCLTEVSRFIESKMEGEVREQILQSWDHFLMQLDPEIAYTPHDPQSLSSDIPYIRDDNDLPILVVAMLEEPEVFLSWDKDFHTPEIRQYLAVYTPRSFLQNFGSKNPPQADGTASEGI